MFKKSKSDSKSYGIIGLGRFGSALAVELAKAGAEPLVIDGNEEKVREMREYTENAFVVSSFDKKTLSETGIQNCDVVVVCIGEKMDISILTTLNVVALGVPTVISKAASAEQGEILKKLGAEVVYPERDMAVRLAHRLEAPNMLDFVQLSKKLNLLKLEVPQNVIGMTIMSADLRGKFGVNIVAIENDGNMTDSVRPDYMFQKGDILLHGHTHIPAWEPFGEGNLYLNPGSVSIPKNGSARSYMTLEDTTFTWKTLPGEAYHTLTI